MSKIIKKQKFHISHLGIEHMTYLLKSETYNHWTNILSNLGNIKDKTIKHFQNRVKKGTCSLVEAHVSIKKEKMTSTQLEVGNSYML